MNEPDSSRGWALVFLEGFLKERVLRVASCRVVLVRASWFISAKGVAYGQAEDRQGKHIVVYGRTSLAGIG